MMKITIYDIENDTGCNEGYFIKSSYAWDADTGPQKYVQYYVIQADGPPQEVFQNLFTTILNTLDIQTLCVTVAEKEPK